MAFDAHEREEVHTTKGMLALLIAFFNMAKEDMDEYFRKHYEGEALDALLDISEEMSGGVQGRNHFDEINEALTGDVDGDFEEYITNDATAIIEVRLNTSHVAKVSETGITVGCQEISFAAFDNLVKAVEDNRGADY